MSRPLITEGKRLISGAEACKLKPYQGSADPAHVWTIGWGHVIKAFEKYLMAGITQAKADEIFQNDLASHVKFIQSDIGSKITLDDYEYAACASFAFNNGARVFTVAPSIVNALRAGKRADAFINFYKFCKSGEPLVYRDGLVYRRLVESILALDKKLVVKPHECIGARKLIADLSKHGNTTDLLSFFNSHHRKDLCVTCKSKH